MKTGPRFAALFVAVTAVLFAALLIAQAAGLSQSAGPAPPAAILFLAIVVVVFLAVLATALIRAVHDGRG